MSIPGRSCLWVLTSTVILLAAAVACGDDDTTPADRSPTATDGSPSTPRPSATPGDSLPPGILQDFPVFPDAELLESTVEDAKLTAIFQSGGSRQDVVAFYQEALTLAPWSLQTVLEPEEEQVTLILFSDRNDPNINGVAAVRVSPENSNTEILVEIVVPSGVTLTATPIGE